MEVVTSSTMISGESTVQAVKGVNVSIGEGEMIAIMGQSFHHSLR